jgi:hypothetical protein
MKRIIMILAVAAVYIISARGQGFRNLNFDSAIILTNDFVNGALSVPVTDALPDWSAYNGPFNGGNALAEINYVTNSLYVGGTLELLGGGAALSGNAFTVYLGAYGAISQTATVPEDAESLQFEATSPGAGMYLTLGGLSLSYSVFSEGPNYTVYGANIPAALDGQTETLTFGMQTGGSTRLDDIEFSAVGIPEPSECALIGLGTILFGLCRRRKLETYSSAAFGHQFHM